MHALPDLRAASTRTRFLHGLGLPLTGARLMLTERALRPYVVTPILVTTVLLGVAWWQAFAWAPSVLAHLLDRPDDAAGWLASLRRGAWVAASVMVHLALIGAFSVLSWFLGGVLASPVYDRLSARVEHMVLGATEEGPFEPVTVLADVALGVAHTLLGLALYLSLACPLALFGLVPVLGQSVELVVGTALSALFLAREVLDYSTSRRRMGFVAKLRLLRDHLPLTLGLGLTTFALLWIPLANLLSMPAAVIGGTLLFCELEASGLIRERATS